MSTVVSHVGDALLLAFGMAWQVGWSLALGFAISGLLQAVVSRERITATLGRDGLKATLVATLAGAASSSCSYASAAVSRTLFKKGAGLVPSLAFLFASTNLVVELGIVLYLLLGWQFMVGEWLGGVVLVVILSLLVRLTYPADLVAAARTHPEPGRGHAHPTTEMRGTLREKLARRATWVAVAQNVAADWAMLWKDLVLGFLIAGALAAFVPDGVWRSLFVTDAGPWVTVPANALVGPLVAVLSFVCSIGNVPMAAVLWGAGVSFGGVLAFLYADLIVLPLLDVYRRYYGIKMAAYIAAVFYATMVAAGIVINVAFGSLGWIPERRADMNTTMTHFAVNYTFWLNLVFGLLTLALFRARPSTAGPPGALRTPRTPPLRRRTMILRSKMAVAALCAGLAAAPAGAQEADPMAGMTGMQHGGPAADAMMSGMDTMSRAMKSAPMTGDADRDFVSMMMPHHQGAIDMARVQLKYGKDPLLRKMAMEIVAAQEHEIAAMQQWQESHPAR